MTAATSLTDTIAQLETEIDDLKKTHELLSLNLPSGVAVQGGGDLYESLRTRLADQDSRAEAERVLAESRIELKTKESELKQMKAKQVREDFRAALAPRLAELHSEVEKVDAIAAQLNAACANLAQMDAAILEDFPSLRSGWSAAMLSTPIANYRQKMITVTQIGGGAIIKTR
jgi:chromosome segregation ATPase